MTIGMRIQENRKRCGFSQEQLAERLGVSRQAVSKWELDSAVPDTDKVVALAGIFKISTDALLVAETESSQGAEKITPLRQSDSLGWLLRLVRTKGYRAGYLLIAWSVLPLAIAGFAGYGAWNKIRMLQTFLEGQPMPGTLLLPQLLIPCLALLLGLAAAIAGIVIVVKYKKK